MPITRPTGRDIRDGSLTDTDIDAANKDGLAGVPSLRTLGTGAQQAAPGDDPRLALNVRTLQHSIVPDSMGVGPRFYVCGQTRASGGTPTNAVAADTAWYLPFVAPPGFVLRGVGIGNTVAPAGVSFNLGVYDSAGVQDLYPGLLVAQLGVSLLNAFAVPFTVLPLNIPLTGNRVYWMVVAFTGGAVTCRTLNTGAADPILGHDANFLAGAAGIGYTNPAPGAILSNPAPAGLSVLASNGAPFLLYGM